MKIEKSVCDVTGDITNTLPVQVKVREIDRHMDAAGDTDEEWVTATRSYDLSHSGAVKLLQEAAKEEGIKTWIINRLEEARRSTQKAWANRPIA